jgi:hypothetical protein
VGETLAETRVELDAQRAENQRTAEELEARVRRALDIKARFRENPALFIGLGAGAVFLVVGGPARVARALRRRMRPTGAEQAYDALPKSMQAWVDAMAAEVGPRAERARETLSEELRRWRQEPLKNKKARRELAKAMVEGPPGPSRTAWKAAEAGLTLLSAALARRAIEAFITGEPGSKPAKAASAESPATGPPANADVARGYSGISGRGRDRSP